MTSPAPTQSKLKLRLAIWLLPPLGLILLWRFRGFGLFRKIFGTLGILLYCLPYTVLILWPVVKSGVLKVEMRGGYIPSLTRAKTLPDFDALEADRQSKAKAAPKNVAAVARAAYWTDFRGPNRDGRYDEQPILTNWPAGGPRLLWRQPIGGGYASFVVAEGRAFTIEQRRSQEVVTAYDVATGHELWAYGYEAEFQEEMGGDGPRATPTYRDGRVYSLGAVGELVCLDAATGKPFWRRNILRENHADDLYYGLAASPLIVEDKVIVTPGGPAGRSVCAYQRLSGEPLWGALDDSQAYSSPMLVTLAGQRQALIVSEQRAVGLGVEDGKLLWETPWVVQMKNRNIAQPLPLGANRFLLSAGYGTGCETVEIVKEATGFSARTVWRNKFLKNKFTSSVYLDGCIYGLDEDILTCLDAETGQRKWKGGRYGYGQLLLASGHLVILCGDGDLALARANPDHPDELARCSAIKGKTWNNPALAGGRLLVRNAAEMACFDLSIPPLAAAR